jgi:hypothetical protein
VWAVVGRGGRVSFYTHANFIFPEKGELEERLTCSSMYIISQNVSGQGLKEVGRMGSCQFIKEGGGEFTFKQEWTDAHVCAANAMACPRPLSPSP